MKRACVFVMVVIFALSLVGCGSSGNRMEFRGVSFEILEDWTVRYIDTYLQIDSLEPEFVMGMVTQTTQGLNTEDLAIAVEGWRLSLSMFNPPPLNLNVFVNTNRRFRLPTITATYTIQGDMRVDNMDFIVIGDEYYAMISFNLLDNDRSSTIEVINDFIASVRFE